MFDIYNNIDNLPLFIIIMIWSLIWKGLALWRAAHLEQKPWFVALLVINTAGILEIIYLLITNKKAKGELGIKNQELDQKTNSN
jgi:uncharacterized protein (DUF983 family)